MPKDSGLDYNYVLTQELNPTPGNASLISEGRMWANAYMASHAWGGSGERVPLTEDLQQFIPVARAYYEDYFAGCVDVVPEEIKWRKVHQVSGRVKERGSVGQGGPGYVIVADLPISNNSLKEFQQAVILMHELYHGVAPLKLHYKGKGEFTIDRSGVAYPLWQSGDMGGNSALEEGLAVRSQIGAMDLVRQHFPKGAENYDKMVDSLKKWAYFDDEKEIVMFVETTEGGHWGIIKQSTDCVKLVEYLIGEISDFERLVERTRIKHETLALARAVEKRFGRGAYKELASARDFQSKEVLGWLKGRSPDLKPDS